MLKKRPYYLLLLLLITGIGISCLKSKKTGIPKTVRRVIDLSGINKVEFLNAMVSYESPADSLKLKALYYLITNIGSHYEITYVIKDTAGNKYTFPLKNYPDYFTLNKHLRLLKEKKGGLKIEHDTILPDIKNIKSSLLTVNIDTAFNSWQHPAYMQNTYSFNSFLQYILPYRVANEKAEPYRNFFRTRYHTKIYNVLKRSQTNLVSLISRIHQVVTQDIKYNKRYNLHYNYPSLNEITRVQMGNYRDIAIYEVKAFRSFGIASTMDYSPYFANSESGYFWPVVLVDNHFIPILYPGISINSLTSQGKLPKVFRRKYDDDSSSLFRIKKMSEHTPTFLGQFCYDDVTDEYVPTFDITVPLTDTSHYAYLAVFNNGSWHSVQWSITNHKAKARFLKMGVNIIYLPMIIRNEKEIPAGLPFLLRKDGNTTTLCNPATKPNKVVNLTKTTPHQEIVPHQKYFLYQWENNRWEIARLLHSNYQKSIKVTLSDLTLYLISKENSPDWFENERPFIVKDKEVIFY